ncbi:MAG: M12 family metallopeptidase [Pirellulaceae bacterium]|nr:matrixin family metalloprotease [Planctomycetales bacterium]
MGMVIKIKGAQQVWPGGVIAHEFADGWSADGKSKVLQAMRDWTEATGGLVTFPEHSNQKFYIRITNPQQSRCALGFNGQSEIECQIKDDANVYVTALHELGHCMGLGHEQLRDDTPAEVMLNIARAQSDGSERGVAFQMEIIRSLIQMKKSDYVKVGGFDKASIMLYASDAKRISDGDVASAKQLYGTSA